ncbi:ABC transporter permease [Paenibacillus sp. P96]|uniref:ABC transporter permease n=1 Tax=Paenibacillus zeirhizosphaerae TaxID=2987519 RepID=A0ABT9FM62_9BACL|nr:ABC transporter permease [Paenibacillus sp. P96]MDP4095819.1 ABC transporter permease [Paenibacillus sp. P96]
MLHLIKLELMKGRKSGYVWGALIAYAIIAGLMLLVLFVDDTLEQVFPNDAEMLKIIDVLTRITFVVYASVLLSRLIIREYKDRTMELLFTYPVSRKKIIFAKLIIVAVWTFINIVISNLLISTVMLFVNRMAGDIPMVMTSGSLFQHYLGSAVQALAAAGMSLLPLAFGMRRKSEAATIVSSIIIVAVISSNNMGFSLSSIIAIPLTLALLGVLVAYLSFRNIDHADIP